MLCAGDTNDEQKATQFLFSVNLKSNKRVIY